MLNVTINEQELRYMWARLNERDRLKALRNPTRKAANKVRRAAQSALKGKSLHNAAAIAKTIRVANFKQKMGFKVRVLTYGEKSMHTNRAGLKKPVAYWFEGGTRDRFTRGTSSRRGKITALGFMSAAAAANSAAVGEIMTGFVGWIERLTSK